MPQLSIAALIALVRSGATISFPTDTVPALAALPKAASKIYEAKGRDASKPLILMAAKPQDLWPYIRQEHSSVQIWQETASTHWPGALTLVLPASSWVPPAMHPQTPETVGVRVPNCAIAQLILQQTGPLATTSVNYSGQPALLTLVEIEAQFPNVYVPLAHHWPTFPKHTLPSTVAQWNNHQWTILRQGTVRLS